VTVTLRYAPQHGERAGCVRCAHGKGIQNPPITGPALSDAQHERSADSAHGALVIDAGAPNVLPPVSQDCDAHEPRATSKTSVLSLPATFTDEGAVPLPPSCSLMPDLKHARSRDRVLLNRQQATLRARRYDAG
jgi:hypothetical protein